MRSVTLHHRIGLVFAIALLSILGPYASGDSAESYVSTTSKEILVPTDELALLVRPLTKSELIVEADDWLALVKAKSKAVSNAEIAIKRKNAQTKAAEGAVDALEDAKKASEKADAAASNLTGQAESASTTKAIEAKKEKADEALEDAKQAIQESVDAQNRSEQDEEINDAIEEADQDAETVAQAEGDTAPKAKPKPDEELNTDSDIDGNAAIDKTTDIAKQAADTAAAQKTNLLDKVNKLREERTELIDRTRVVLNELDAKGGDTVDYRLYLTAVSGVDVDVSDWAAMQATIIGWFKSEQGGLRWAGNIASFIAILLCFWIASMLLGRLVDGLMNTKHTRKMSVLMRKFVAKMARRIVLMLGLIVALSSLEISVGPILAAIGAAGFVVAFALQDSLSNFASGIMILVYRPFDVGDVVETGGVSGKVTTLNLVSVGINTFDNKLVLVPNNKVWNDVIINATSVRERRVDMTFGIGYDCDMAVAQTVLERIVSEHELVLKMPEPVIKVHELADSSVNFICRPWVKTEDYWTVYWDITRRVKEDFDAAGISIPFPQQDVHVHHSTIESQFLRPTE